MNDVRGRYCITTCKSLSCLSCLSGRPSRRRPSGSLHDSAKKGCALYGLHDPDENMRTSRFLAQLKSTLQVSHDYSVVPAGLAWRSNTLFILATVAVGMFTDLFLYGLVVPILPYLLQDRLGLPPDQVQSHVDGLLVAYAGASVLFSPVAGYVADKTSTRQAPFLLGLVTLMLATLLLFAGASVAVLTIARVLQGISAAFVWTIGLALCLETVGPENLGKTIGSVRTMLFSSPRPHSQLLAPD